MRNFFKFITSTAILLPVYAGLAALVGPVLGVEFYTFILICSVVSLLDDLLRDLIEAISEAVGDCFFDSEVSA